MGVPTAIGAVKYWLFFDLKGSNFGFYGVGL